MHVRPSWHERLGAHVSGGSQHGSFKPPHGAQSCDDSGVVTYDAQHG
jgi:hypothetical protein